MKVLTYHTYVHTYKLIGKPLCIETLCINCLTFLFICICVVLMYICILNDMKCVYERPKCIRRFINNFIYGCVYVHMYIRTNMNKLDKYLYGN